MPKAGLNLADIHNFKVDTLYSADVIEKQLAHNPRDKIRGVYNRAEYLPERRKMMQEWANYLTKLKTA